MTLADLVATLTAEEKLRHYTAEEVINLGLLPGTARTLLDDAYGKRIPHTKVKGKIRWRLDHIAQISIAGDVDPAARGRKLPPAKRAARAA